ncbi:MAG: hypothetical protein FWG87_03260 [Defluviitaleaceae bacterium]|nr:hypothetical protein [Defluviitaleaceae bacterium]
MTNVRLPWQATSINARRGSLGADKSAPYKTARRPRLHRFKNTSEKIRENPLNPRKSAFHKSFVILPTLPPAPTPPTTA